MKLTEQQLKIASEIYTYLKSAQDIQNQNCNINAEKAFKDLKSFLFAKKQSQFCNLIDKCNQCNILSDILQKRDQKNYTLLMIAVSNNLYQSVSYIIEKIKNTLQYYSIIDATITLKGRDFRTFFNFKMNNGQLTDQEIQEYNKIKTIQITALDIAKLKNNTEIINLLNS